MSFIQDIRRAMAYGSRAVNQIIAVNITMFVLTGILFVIAALYKQNHLNQQVNELLALPASFEQFANRPWTLFTFMFMHAGILHILFNMLWLYWMGKMLYEYQGEKKVWYTYVFGSIFGGLCFMIAFNVFPALVESKNHAAAVGASAGVMAILMSVATLLPNYRIFLFLIGEVKLKWFALVIFIIDILMLNSNNVGGHFAHIGGAIWGVLAMTLLKRGIDVYLPFQKFFLKTQQWIRFKPKRSPKVKKMNIVYTAVQHKAQEANYKENTYTAGKAEEIPDQEEIDRILDKILEKGMNSLTRQEKEILAKVKDK